MDAILNWKYLSIDHEFHSVSRIKKKKKKKRKKKMHNYYWISIIGPQWHDWPHEQTNAETEEL